jgi:hypothetical protein
MVRSIPRVLSIAVLASMVAVACSGVPEEEILRHFFAASRLRDRTALSTFAVAEFNPKEHGIVGAFEVVSVSDERRVAAESDIVRMSVDDPANPVDVTRYDVELVAKDVTIAAPTRMPDGSTVDKTHVVSMQRALLKGDTDVDGRWIITAIRDGSASAATPRS